MTKPIGDIVDPLPRGATPDLRVVRGNWMELHALAAIHAKGLYQSIVDADAALWTYMPYGPFVDATAFSMWLAERQAARDPWFYSFINVRTGEPCGMGAFMRADAKNGVIEIGNIWMSPALQRTREATEVIFLMMRHAFDDLGVRRLEWKCDALNAPSRKAAVRFGFAFEGVFRQHLIVKGRNRDTAWFAIIDSDWPKIKAGFERWLDPSNFDAGGCEIAKLRVS
jgi:RimJ/RimL family protein N-acetyltransferase